MVTLHNEAVKGGITLYQSIALVHMVRWGLGYFHATENAPMG